MLLNSRGPILLKIDKQMPAGLSGQCRHGTDPGAAPAP
jgi:hypothetical protein